MNVENFSFAFKQASKHSQNVWLLFLVQYTIYFITAFVACVHGANGQVGTTNAKWKATKEHCATCCNAPCVSNTRSQETRNPVAPPTRTRCKCASSDLVEEKDFYPVLLCNFTLRSELLIKVCMVGKKGQAATDDAHSSCKCTVVRCQRVIADEVRKAKMVFVRDIMSQEMCGCETLNRIYC